MLGKSWMAVVGLLVALVLTVRVEESRMNRIQRRATTLALQAANVAAEQDSTRNVASTNPRVAMVLGDSLRIAERRVLQLAQQNDVLDEALAHARQARYRMAAAVDSFHQLAVGSATVDTGGERHASFDVHQTPYTITARVDILGSPDSARLEVGVALDPIPMDLRLGCSEPDGDGVRVATVNVTTPQWASVRFDRVEQTRELCAAPTQGPGGARSARRFAFTPLAAGVGRMLGVDGRWKWGLFIGAGVRAW